MNGEYYSGWFDTWGRVHRTAPSDHGVSDLSAFMRSSTACRSASTWSHGEPRSASGRGRTIRSYAGHVQLRLRRADQRGRRDDAPSLWAIRRLLAAHLAAGESLPAPPAGESADRDPALWPDGDGAGPRESPRGVAGRPAAARSRPTARGAAAPSIATELPAGPAAALLAKAVHDFAWVFVDGVRRGTMDRRSNRFAVPLAGPGRPGSGWRSWSRRWAGWNFRDRDPRPQAWPVRAGGARDGRRRRRRGGAEALDRLGAATRLRRAGRTPLRGPRPGRAVGTGLLARDLSRRAAGRYVSGSAHLGKRAWSG